MLSGGVALIKSDSVVLAAGMGLAEAARPPAFVAIIRALYSCNQIRMLSYSDIGSWFVVLTSTTLEC